jgi:hypothetical protein
MVDNLATSLSAAADRLRPAEAARVCGRVADSVVAILLKSTAVPLYLGSQAHVLSVLAKHLGPREAARIAAVLAQVIRKSTNPAVTQALTEPLAVLALRLPPADSARLCAPVVRSLMRFLPQSSRYAGGRSAQYLAVLASRLEPGETVARLTEAMNRTTDPDALMNLAQGLLGVRDRLSPEKATVLAKVLIDAGANPRTTGSSYHATRGLRPVLVRVDPLEDLLRANAVSVLTDPGGVRTARSLSRMMHHPDFEPARRASAVVALVGCLAQTRQPVPALAAVGRALRQPTCRLSTPQLVELLKQPTCTGPSRRIVLDQLEARYRRPFADHWAFVRFARQKKLDLDLLSPPKRGVLVAKQPRK